MRLFVNMEESAISRVFNNEEFGIWKITVLQPQLDNAGNPVRDKKGKLIADKDKTDTEIVPFTYPNGIEGFMENEVHPYAPYAWVDEKKTQIGYEMSFTKYFYKPVQLRTMDDIVGELRKIEKDTDGILSEIVEVRHE